MEVRQGSAAYPVYIGSGLRHRLGALLDELRLPARRVAVVARRVDALYGRDLREALPGADWLTFEDGESEKTLRNVESLLGDMLRLGLRRDALAVVIGGGVTGDAAGFAASIFVRGISFVHVPTTLLAQVDSSIGGKLGVNHELGKNLIGTFAAPSAVISDSDFLGTLSDADFRSGIFEALKSGVIGDPALFAMIEEGVRKDDSQKLQQIVRASVTVKGAIVSRDERESGERRLLNYGHTIGHAIETALDYRGITHGEAVAWGMIASNAISAARGLLPGSVRERIDRAILALQPARPTGLDPDTLLKVAGFDKKFEEGKRHYVVAEELGRCRVIDVTVAELAAGVDEMLRVLEKRNV